MMFEELAETYVNGKVDGGHFDLEQFGMAYFSESSMKQAFLAGLKAGRPTWHKVADGDLPPVRMVVLVSGYLGDMKDLQGFDEWDGEKWLNEDMPGFVRVAWCEVPTFEES